MCTRFQALLLRGTTLCPPTAELIIYLRPWLFTLSTVGASPPLPEACTLRSAWLENATKLEDFKEKLKRVSSVADSVEGSSHEHIAISQALNAAEDAFGTPQVLPRQAYVSSNTHALIKQKSSIARTKNSITKCIVKGANGMTCILRAWKLQRPPRKTHVVFGYCSGTLATTWRLCIRDAKQAQRNVIDAVAADHRSYVMHVTRRRDINISCSAGGIKHHELKMMKPRKPHKLRSLTRNDGAPAASAAEEPEICFEYFKGVSMPLLRQYVE